MQQIKEVMIRKAIKSDYESVTKIMSQVQDMHVKWRPDIYKPNQIRRTLLALCPVNLNEN